MTVDDPCKRRRCTGKGKPCKNFALEDSEWCSLHDPALAERRAAAGRKRIVRFSTAVRVDGVPLDRSKVPTTARIIDDLLEVTERLDSKQLGPREGAVMVSALKAAGELLWREREATGKSPGPEPATGVDATKAFEDSFVEEPIAEQH